MERILVTCSRFLIVEIIVEEKGGGGARGVPPEVADGAVPNHIIAPFHNSKGILTNATLQIFNMRGSCVRTIKLNVDDNSYSIGPVLWNLTGDNGVRVAPGIYIARFTATTAEGDRITEHGKIIVK